MGKGGRIKLGFRLPSRWRYAGACVVTLITSAPVAAIAASTSLPPGGNFGAMSMSLAVIMFFGGLTVRGFVYRSQPWWLAFKLLALSAAELLVIATSHYVGALATDVGCTIMLLILLPPHAAALWWWGTPRERGLWRPISLSRMK